MQRIAVPSLLLAMCFVGCALDRSPIFPIGDAGMDASDAPGADVPGLDAPPVDAPIDGAIDSGLDAPLDAPLDVPPDVPIDARCSTGPDTDGDGAVDACDPCPADATDDSDGDGRCDSMDACPGSDDRVDGDGDGAPDGCDSWPCGVEPTVALPVTLNEATVTSLSLAGGDNTLVATAGATVSAAVGYSIVDCGCTGCLDQIEIGLSPGARAFCAYDGNPNCPAATTGMRTGNIVVPAASGIYEVRFSRAQDIACNHMGRSDWWLPSEAAGRIGVVCVP